MKIAFFEISQEEEAFFSKHLISASYDSEALAEKHIPHLLQTEIISIFIHSKITRSVLQKLPNLKIVITRSTGTDHIDLIAAQENNISIKFLSRYATRSVAEFTLMLIFLLARKLYEITHDQKTSVCRGFNIEHKTLGVIGVGCIGKEVIKLARSNNMNVIAHDKNPDEQCAKNLKFEYVDLQALYAKSDIITLHLPLQSSTQNFIKHEDLKKIKPGMLLINTARGGLIENDVIIKGLKKNIFKAIALDVLLEEYTTRQAQKQGIVVNGEKHELKAIISNIYLMKHPRVIITHHNAYNTEESTRNSMQETLAMIEEWKKETHEI